MEKKNKNIIKDQNKRLSFIKNELKKLILKSLKKNKVQTLLSNAYINYHLTKKTKKSSISRQNNLCLMQGRSKGTYKIFHLCRHAITKLAVVGNLQNTRIKSW